MPTFYCPNCFKGTIYTSLPPKTCPLCHGNPTDAFASVSIDESPRRAPSRARASEPQRRRRPIIEEEFDDEGDYVEVPIISASEFRKGVEIIPDRRSGFKATDLIGTKNQEVIRFGDDAYQAKKTKKKSADFEKQVLAEFEREASQKKAGSGAIEIGGDE